IFRLESPTRGRRAAPRDAHRMGLRLGREWGGHPRDAVAAHILRRGGALVVVDEGGGFYPGAGAQLAIPPDPTPGRPPGSPKAALWAWEQSLRCLGVAVTFGKIDPTNDRAIRRLQIAAEAGGGLAFLIPPPGNSGTPWAAARIRVEPHAEREAYDRRPHAPREDQLMRRLRVRVVRGQVGSREEVAELELGHEAGDVPEAPELAGPVALRRPGRPGVG